MLFLWWWRRRSLCVIYNSLPIQSEPRAQCEQSSVFRLTIATQPAARPHIISLLKLSVTLFLLYGSSESLLCLHRYTKRLVKNPSIRERRVSRYEELNLSYNFMLTEYIWDPFFKYGHLQFHPNVSRSISDTCCFTKNLSANVREM